MSKIYQLRVLIVYKKLIKSSSDLHVFSIYVGEDLKIINIIQLC